MRDNWERLTEYFQYTPAIRKLIYTTNTVEGFAIQDRDISTVDIYFLDYIQYMDELKGQQNFDNPTKEDGQKWKKLLEENAKYHKTLHFDSDNAKS